MIDWRFVSVAHRLSKTEMGGCLVEWWLPFYLNERKVKQSNAYKMNEQYLKLVKQGKQAGIERVLHIVSLRGRQSGRKEIEMNELA